MTYLYFDPETGMLTGFGDNPNAAPSLAMPTDFSIDREFKSSRIVAGQLARASVLPPLTRRRLRLGLLSIGIRSPDIEAVIAAIPDAEARERLAQAEATATAMVSEAIGKGDIQAANFLIAERYTDALKAIASGHNSKVVIVPIEAAALAGTVGGIAQLTKAVFGEDAEQARRTSGSVPAAGRASG